MPAFFYKKYRFVNNLLCEEDLSCLWEGRFSTMRDVYQKFNTSNMPSSYDLIVMNGDIKAFSKIQDVIDRD